MFALVKILARILGALIQIGANTRIHSSRAHAQNSIVIGKNCLIAANCQITDGSRLNLSPSKYLAVSTTARPIAVEYDVWLGTGVIVLPGTTNKGRRSNLCWVRCLRGYKWEFFLCGKSSRVQTAVGLRNATFNHSDPSATQRLPIL